MKTTHVTVGIYETDRCYGGSEEGGWWYDAGYIRKRITVPARQAPNALRQAYAWVDARPKPAYPIHSVAYRGGAFAVRIFDGRRAPTAYPTRRPHYE